MKLLEYKQYFEKEPIVKLYKTFTEPFKNAIATARTCYSSKGIINDEDVTEKNHKIAIDTYTASHHTVWTHTHFQFQLSNVSRQFIWSFLHQNTYSVSEQVSQRFTEVKLDSVIIPKREFFSDDDSYNLYKETINYSFDIYHKLTDLLMPTIKEQYKKIFKHKNTEDKVIENQLRKKALEVARYCLPIGTYAHLYHTISAISLFRYYKLCNQFDVPFEARAIITKMVEEVLKVEPNYLLIIEDPLDILETPEFEYFINSGCFYSRSNNRKEFIEEFDSSLDGHMSKLISYDPNAEEILASSTREVLGVTRNKLSNEDALDLLLNPAKNSLLAETLDLLPLSKFGKILCNTSFSFRRKISHTADSQAQRQRACPGARPIINHSYYAFPDYITPNLLNYNSEALELYKEAMIKIWHNINILTSNALPEYESGFQCKINPQFLQYLLPNSVTIRYTESGNLAGLYHKYILRLCFLAQEEIGNICIDEVKQIKKLFPIIGKYLQPPCGLNYLKDKNSKKCTQPTYCGVPVWKLQIEDYKRIL